MLGAMPLTMQSNRKLICSPSEQDRKKTPAPRRWTGNRTTVDLLKKKKKMFYLAHTHTNTHSDVQ